MSRPHHNWYCGDGTSDQPAAQAGDDCGNCIAEESMLAITSSRGIAITVDRLPTPGGRVPTIEVRYGDGGKGKVCWWPEVDHCRGQIAEVLEHFKNDRTSLGFPIRQGSEAARAALAAWSQANRIDPGGNSDADQRRSALGRHSG